jgi:hypothetical protein
MSKAFKVGDHVSWNSEAGRVSGVISQKITSDTLFKGYIHHASQQEPQYIINSDKTDHIAIHKGSALRLLTGSRKLHSGIPKSGRSPRTRGKTRNSAPRNSSGKPAS